MASQVVIFTVGQEEYGMPIEIVREITRLGDIRPIPQSPPYVLGLINLRGQAIPLIDLHVRFGLASASCQHVPVQQTEGGTEANSLALITEIQGSLVGFAVDYVREVRILDNVVPPPALVTVPFIGGIVNLPDRIIMQLVPERILEEDELKKLKALS